MYSNAIEQVRVDVLVVGAGSAGVAAAVAAAEGGAATLLLEASGAVGGTLAGQLLEHSVGFHDVHGKQVIAGFGQRLVERLVKEGASPGHVRDDMGYTATRTPVNHAELSLVEACMLGEAGVMLWLHAPVVKAVEQSDGTLVCTVETRAGQRVIAARALVDTSGDAIAARLLGARVQRDAAEKRQPTSLLFKLGAVDFGPLLDYAHDHPDDFREGSVFGTTQDEHVNFWGFGRLLREGHVRGDLRLLRNEMHVAGWPQRGELVINVNRHTAEDDSADATGQAYMALAAQVMEFARWFRKCVPGCANAYVAAIANQVGVRESVRIVGQTTVSAEQVLNGARCTDAIAQAAFPIDIHAANQASLSHAAQLDRPFDIPYGALVVEGLQRVFVAGRCVSSTHEANGSLRITATCFATGEAAGAAAALAAQGDIAATALPVAALQDRLRKRGVLLRAGVDVASPA